MTADSFGVVGGTTLAPGEFNTYTATYTVVQADIDGGGLRNTATGVGTPLGGGPDVTDISDDDIDDDGNTLSDPTDLAASSSPSIETVKTVVITDDTGPTGLSDGDTVTYTIVNTNTGNVTLTDVNIQSDTLTRLNGNPIGSLTADSFGCVLAAPLLLLANSIRTRRLTLSSRPILTVAVFVILQQALVHR